MVCSGSYSKRLGAAIDGTRAKRGARALALAVLSVAARMAELLAHDMAMIATAMGVMDVTRRVESRACLRPSG